MRLFQCHRYVEKMYYLENEKVVYLAWKLKREIIYL